MKSILATIIMAVLLSGSALAVCIDSDSGALSYAPGSASDDDATYDDFCLENGNVMEFTCAADEASSEEMPCLLGCHYNWQGIGKCIPTAGGSTSSIPLGSSSSDSFTLFSEEQPQIEEVPEFSFIAAGIALIGASGGYLLLRSRK